MKGLLAALKDKDGQKALIGMAIGILISSVGGELLKNSVIWCDLVIIGGCIFSLVGVEQFGKLIIKYQSDYGER